ncbi:MAG TPA: glycosyltransferase N-terminal domain-containing protein [Membranihabitans sp.]|nr:glycosyltransferase N-terminal domain-containing protein [Membranihabitans sp.]
MAYFIYRYLSILLAFVARRVGFLNSKLRIRNQGLSQQQVDEITECIWIHCASLGEFEQGKVLIDALRTRYPEQYLVLTFYSSSGFEKRKSYSKVDRVYYLPYDTPKEIHEFLDKINPILVLFVKYEFWFNFLDILNRRGVPFFFVSAVFRPGQYLFVGSFSSLLTRILKAAHIFVQNQESLELLQSVGYRRITIAGDTRIDRVMELRDQEFKWTALEEWIGERSVIIAGSTWSKDENLIARVMPEYPSMKWIIAPHEVNRDHLEKMKQTFGEKALFLSDIGMEQSIPYDKNLLIIDRIGILSVLYRYGSLAYIGGGFGSGIHNTLEPAVYGLPLIFGPRYSKFQEAVDFIDLQVAQSIRNAGELAEALNYFRNPRHQQKVRNRLHEYFLQHSGSVNTILGHLDKILIKKL